MIVVEGVLTEADDQTPFHEGAGHVVQGGLLGGKERHRTAIGHQHQLKGLAGQGVLVVAGILEGKGQPVGILEIHMQAEIVIHAVSLG